MKNNLSLLPWNQEQFWRVENYEEAIGVLSSIKAGIDSNSVRRPLSPTKVSF
tara:strand:+ start:5940 stop:6095 length:156 start_codon:yes stop_codon:yes gene_type:complete